MARAGAAEELRFLLEEAHYAHLQHKYSTSTPQVQKYITSTPQVHHKYIATTPQLHHIYTSLHIRITPAIYIKAPPPFAKWALVRCPPCVSV